LKELPESYLSGMNLSYADGGIFSNKNISWRGINVICPSHKFYYITHGSCVLQENNRTYEAKSGMWFLIPAGVRHSFYAEDGVVFQKYWLHFNLESSGNSFFSLVKLPRSIIVGNDRHIKNLFKNVFKFAGDERLSSILRLKSALLDLVAAYVERAEQYEIAPQKGDASELSNVMQFIEDNLQRQITNTELASVAGMHPNYFIRFFKDKTGITPAKYITVQRIERAKTLLETTEKPISEIMQQLGFDDISHFSSLFKHYAGYSPKYYREYYLKQEVHARN